jgi:hypothetical protein
MGRVNTRSMALFVSLTSPTLHVRLCHALVSRFPFIINQYFVCDRSIQPSSSLRLCHHAYALSVVHSLHDSTYAMMQQVFARNGLESFAPLGEKFDPNKVSANDCVRNERSPRFRQSNQKVKSRLHAFSPVSVLLRFLNFVPMSKSRTTTLVHLIMLRVLRNLTFPHSTIVLHATVSVSVSASASCHAVDHSTRRLCKCLTPAKPMAPLHSCRSPVTRSRAVLFALPWSVSSRTANICLLRSLFFVLYSSFLFFVLWKCLVAQLFGHTLLRSRVVCPS